MLQTSCLGISFLPPCTYDPANPQWRIISLGDTIAAISFLIAFTQLLTPKKRYLLEPALTFIYLLWGLATVLILLASVLPISPYHSAHLLGAAIFWELLGSVILLGSIAYLVNQLTTPLTFKPKTARKIYSLTERIIATGDAKDHAELALSLRSAVPDLIAVNNEFDSLEYARSASLRQRYKISEATRTAGQILRLWSDESFCKVVVTREPSFAISVFHAIQLQSVYRNNNAKVFVWEIVRQALLNPDSILHRESSYKGLSIVQAFTKATFGNAEFNEQMTPLGHFYVSLREDLSTRVIQLFGTCFLRMLDAYLENESFYSVSFALNSAKSTLIGFLGQKRYTLDRYSSEDLFSSSAWVTMAEVSNSIWELIRKMADCPALTVNELLDFASKVDQKQDYTPYRFAADLFYEFLESLTHTRKHDVALRDLTIQIWMDLYPQEPTEFHKQVHIRFEKRLFEQLRVNFEEGRYPAISRPIIEVLGLHEETGTADTDLKNRLFDYLKRTFPTLYAKDKEAALDKLPVGVRYDESHKRLIQSSWRGTERILQL